jgi:HEAT repeat protein
MLSAIVQAPPTARLRGVLVAFARDAKLMGAPEYDELLARAAARHRDVLMIPLLIERLERRFGREAIRTALLAMGEPAFREVWETLRDPHRDRRLRVHLPRTLARFGTQEAVDRLLELLETESDGLVRYKAIRGLGHLIGNRFLRVDRLRIERLAHHHLVEHFRILGLRVALDAPSPAMTPEDPRRAAATGRLLAGLLDDKLRQSLERVFRMLKIAHRREDFRSIHAATQSHDARARANASEYIDTLLRYRDQVALRELLRVVTDDLDAAERAKRAAVLLEREDPKSYAEALLALINDTDATVSTIAAAHAAALGDETFRRAVSQAREAQPGLAERLARLFDIPTRSTESAHAGG